MTLKRDTAFLAWGHLPLRGIPRPCTRRPSGLRMAETAMPLLIVITLLLASVSAAPSDDPASTAPSQRVALPPFDPLALVDQLAAARDQDPIGYLVTDTDELTGLLARFNTHVPVQPKQAQVLARLDKLIEMLEKQCRGSGGASPNPTTPMADSKIAQG